MPFQIEDGVLKKYTEEKGVTEVIIPDNVTAIGIDAFNNCENIVNIFIPDSVTQVSGNAFHNCEKLTSISVPKHLKNDIFISSRLGFFGFSNNIKIVVRPAIFVKNLPYFSSVFKDSSRSPKKSETEMIFLYYKVSEDEDAKIYVENHLSEFIKSLIDKQNLETITDITEHTEFLTLENIDEFLDYAIDKARNTKESASFKIQVLLTNYKVQLLEVAESENN